MEIITKNTAETNNNPEKKKIGNKPDKSLLLIKELINNINEQNNKIIEKIEKMKKTWFCVLHLIKNTVENSKKLLIFLIYLYCFANLI